MDRQNYREFTSIMEEWVGRQLPAGYETRLDYITQNNGARRQVLIISGGQSGFCPAFNMQEYYDRCRSGENQQDLADEIVTACLDAQMPGAGPLAGDPEDFDNVRQYLVLRVVNYEKNRDFLEDRVCRRQMDLALTVCLSCPAAGEQAALSTVSRQLADRWEVSGQELFEIARENTIRLQPPLLERLQDALLPPEPGQEEDEADLAALLEGSSGDDIFLLTCRQKRGGAVHMFDRRLLGQISSCLGRDLYILPSSVHEVLLVPAGSGNDPGPGPLSQIVQNVNREVVSQEEFLSDHVYRFIRADGRLVIAA